MKKISVVTLVLLLAFFCILYVVNSKKTDSVITPKQAASLAVEKLDDKSKETITNLDNPKVEEHVFEKQPFIGFFDGKKNLKGKKVYKVTFNTTQDGLLGPIVLYVDMQGKVIGTDFRE